jgi:GNAT superfamily N-acetyltransferase
VGRLADGSVIGFVSVSEEEHWCGEKDAWVGELMVDQRFESNGVARSLVARVEEWATHRGLGHIRLSTGATNHGARAFYERLGYGLNEVTMTRQLPTSARFRTSSSAAVQARPEGVPRLPTHACHLGRS